MKYEKSAGIITYYLDTKNSNEVEYLLLCYAAGHWDFPKGIIEKFEDEVQAAQRELQEEAGISAKIDSEFKQPISYIFKDKQGELVSKQVTFFVGRTDQKDISLSHEHIDYKWLKLDAALKQLTYSNAKQLLILVDQYIEKKLN